PVVTVKDGNGTTVTPNEFNRYRKSPLTVNVANGDETFTAKVDTGGAGQSVPVTLNSDGDHTIVFTGSKGDVIPAEVFIDTSGPTFGSSVCPGNSVYYLNQGVDSSHQGS